MARRKAAVVAEQQRGDERPPLYDPAVHTDPEQWVFTELYCECGGLWRQRDPVAYVEPQVRAFLARHSGEGHGPATKKACITAREQRRKAAYAVAGQVGRYQPKQYPHIDSACTKRRPWPVFPDQKVEG
ncbi:hypothetical protein SAMN05443637_13522 [Pseudonocardia thermophila]|uniref:Uncharacterized protein n=1 Tax=Pseudonocardia thermophila TaxID=1848 RepID=A0A1M7BEE5_PSETH|nr:hypothetical protein [Pseudonocardia thermophila]SHL53226.1 hypothetical protein SAMN05443637_13522 [Pseudonocardia thermophila]